jgi:5-methylthioadenosine/S-adenosylhomocysteine deaminase
MTDLLIRNCDILFLPQNRTGLQANQDIAISGIRIYAIEPTGHIQPEEAQCVIEARGLLAIPGLVNTHAHVPMVLFRGLVEDVPITAWFNDYIWPLESYLTAEDGLPLIQRKEISP